MKISVKLITILTGCLLCANALFAFNRQDTLRGSNGAYRSWWNVCRYELNIQLDTAERSLIGKNKMQFLLTGPVNDSMQIDLQEPMIMDSIFLSEDIVFPERKDKLSFVREGNVYWVYGLKRKLSKSGLHSLVFCYHGKPRAAVKPPWDGGFIWTKDSLGNPWISVACQGLGASSWWPCKDYQGDEPDSGVIFKMKTFDHQLVESNGDRVANSVIGYYKMPVPRKKNDPDYMPELFGDYHAVKNPINTYDVCFYAGNYMLLGDTMKGLKGVLNIHLAPLAYNNRRMYEKLPEVKKMLQAFEYWFGPYPFYEDGYKIVEAPFLGMEHQSAIAYGNKYQMGYQGKDRSGTGVGLLFDFIIVHESGHEWFGNSITAADIADNWIHEGFTTYSETLFAEYWFGREKAFEYTRGEWKNILNDRNVIGTYGVNDAGSSDKYDKGSALVHTIRLLMNDDDKFRAMLHKMNDTFYHRQITTKQMEDFITGFSGLKLEPIFNQYLRSTMIPELQWSKKGKKLNYRFANTVDGFELPVTMVAGGKEQLLHTTAEWQIFDLPTALESPDFPATFLVRVKNID